MCGTWTVRLLLVSFMHFRQADVARVGGFAHRRIPPRVEPHGASVYRPVPSRHFPLELESVGLVEHDKRESQRR